MNWLDLILIAVVIVGAYVDLKTGLIGAAFTALGVILGVVLAGQLSDDVGALFADSIPNDALVTVMSYAIIIVVAVVVARIAGSIVRKIVSMLFLGFVDRLGGLALGLVSGAVVCAAIITGMAGLTYTFEIPVDGPAEKILGKLPQVVNSKKGLERALTESDLAPTFIAMTDPLPTSALSFIPTDFTEALDTLKEKIESQDKSPLSDSAPKPTARQ